jgi:hypothetical protein
MLPHVLLRAILLVTTSLSGLLAGISLDQAVVQLPARHPLGDRAYAAFIWVTDLQSGLCWSPLITPSAPARPG